jgi:hypothetical protein
MLYRAAALFVTAALAAGCSSSDSDTEVTASDPVPDPAVEQTSSGDSSTGYTSVSWKLNGDVLKHSFDVDSDVIIRELNGVKTVMTPSEYCEEAHERVADELAGTWLEGTPETGSRHHLIGAEEFSVSVGGDGTAVTRVVTVEPLAVGDAVLLSDLCGDGTTAGALEALSSIFIGRVVADESNGTDFSYELERISPLAAGMPVGEKAIDSDSDGTDESDSDGTDELDVAPVSGVSSTKAQECSGIIVELRGEAAFSPTGDWDFLRDSSVDIYDPETVVTEYMEDCTVVETVGYVAGEFESTGTDEPAEELDAVTPCGGISVQLGDQFSYSSGQTRAEFLRETVIDINDPEAVIAETLDDCTVIQTVGGVDTVYTAGEFCSVYDRQQREKADASPAELAAYEGVGFFYGAEEFRIISGGNSIEGGSGEAKIWTKTPLAVGDGIIASDSCLLYEMVKGIYYGVVTADVSDDTGFVYETAEVGLAELVTLPLFGL